MKKLKIYAYRLYEMILWIIVIIVCFISAMFTTIPYIITGKDYIGYISKLHTKLLFKKSKK